MIAEQDLIRLINHPDNLKSFLKQTRYAITKMQHEGALESQRTCENNSNTFFEDHMDEYNYIISLIDLNNEELVEILKDFENGLKWLDVSSSHPQFMDNLHKMANAA